MTSTGKKQLSIQAYPNSTEDIADETVEEHGVVQEADGTFILNFKKVANALYEEKGKPIILGRDKYLKALDSQWETVYANRLYSTYHLAVVIASTEMDQKNPEKTVRIQEHRKQKKETIRFIKQNSKTSEEETSKPHTLKYKTTTLRNWGNGAYWPTDYDEWRRRLMFYTDLTEQYILQAPITNWRCTQHIKIASSIVLAAIENNRITVQRKEN